MGEVKQTNFRIDQDTADAFRTFCEEKGWNQAQGFDHLMYVVETDRAKAAIPGRLTEIESFEKSVKDIMAAFLYSLEVNQNAEGRIREQFASDLEKNKKEIDELKQKVEKLQADKDNAEAMASEAVKAREQAEKDTMAAEKVRIAAEKTAEDKQTIADTLAAKLAEAENKLAGYDDLKAALSASEDARKSAEQQIKDVQRDAAEAAKDAAREAEKAKEQAVRKVSDALQAEVSDLKDKLRISMNKTETARRDADTAKTTAIAELSEAHKVEIEEIRTKLDNRTDELMKATQEISALQVKLQTIQAEKNN